MQASGPSEMPQPTRLRPAPDARNPRCTDRQSPATRAQTVPASGTRAQAHPQHGHLQPKQPTNDFLTSMQCTETRRAPGGTPETCLAAWCGCGVLMAPRPSRGSGVQQVLGPQNRSRWRAGPCQGSIGFSTLITGCHRSLSGDGSGTQHAGVSEKHGARPVAGSFGAAAPLVRGAGQGSLFLFPVTWGGLLSSTGSPEARIGASRASLFFGSELRFACRLRKPAPIMLLQAGRRLGQGLLRLNGRSSVRAMAVVCAVWEGHRCVGWRISNPFPLLFCSSPHMDTMRPASRRACAASGEPMPWG